MPSFSYRDIPSRAPVFLSPSPYPPINLHQPCPQASPGPHSPNTSSTHWFYCPLWRGGPGITALKAFGLFLPCVLLSLLRLFLPFPRFFPPRNVRGNFLPSKYWSSDSGLDSFIPLTDQFSFDRPCGFFSAFPLSHSRGTPLQPLILQIGPRTSNDFLFPFPQLCVVSILGTWFPFL